MEQKIEYIQHIVAWLRTFEVGQKRTAQFDSPKSCQTLSVLLARWNYEEGIEKGMRLCASYNRRLAQATVRALSLVEIKRNGYA